MKVTRIELFEDEDSDVWVRLTFAHAYEDHEFVRVYRLTLFAGVDAALEEYSFDAEFVDGLVPMYDGQVA